MPKPILKSAFPPSVDGNTRLLLLGSLPGERSLAAGEYYAHPTNAFWWLIGEVLGEADLPRLPYAQRLEELKTRGVGLWDVIAKAQRTGSLDTAIRSATLRNLEAFAQSLPRLRAIGFNGGTAAKAGRRQLAGADGAWNLIDLPSSSAAYASMPREAKLAAWREIERYLA
ncbi:2-hydroxyacid dehydrogenase [Novosphingobium barchaimii LL02]|uniref:2-hydroxyacid dehydrogenase n=1 Tax=Novosphingobium barchaimii LL02 TaxID=1114963 RepID=A0A0J7XGF5_9SPHN|nr:DNA-deoxyinosine glycosylase [Novosphingobium barchaimii]KMS50872.1 2-hydroxyacid dehydrogenase [Novosphingobium barchaimii LL02]